MCWRLIRRENMAYEIELNIDGEKKKFIRNEPPMLREMTKALIVQQQQLKMYSKDDGPTEDDFNKNEKNLANFAAGFDFPQDACDGKAVVCIEGGKNHALTFDAHHLAGREIGYEEDVFADQFLGLVVFCDT